VLKRGSQRKVSSLTTGFILADRVRTNKRGQHLNTSRFKGVIVII
jgi:hypothetical protein